MMTLQENKLIVSGALVIGDLASLCRSLPSKMNQIKAVDLSGVKAVDSSGVAFLLTLQQRVGHSLTLIGLSQGARVLLDLYNLNELFSYQEGDV